MLLLNFSRNAHFEKEKLILKVAIIFYSHISRYNRQHITLCFYSAKIVCLCMYLFGMAVIAVWNNNSIKRPPIYFDTSSAACVMQVYRNDVADIVTVTQVPLSDNPPGLHFILERWPLVSAIFAHTTATAIPFTHTHPHSEILQNKFVISCSCVYLWHSIGK